MFAILPDIWSVISREVVFAACGRKIKNSWLNQFFLIKVQNYPMQSIGYINLIFCCVASVLFHCFQSLSVVGHKFSTLIQRYFTPFFLA